MIVAYIAGPYRADSAWVVELNIRNAEALALDCWQAGVAVICPHANTRFFDGALPDECWLVGDLAIMERCDVVVLTPDWERSEGATAEREEAARLNIPVVVGLAGLRQWLDQRGIRTPWNLHVGKGGC